MSRPRYLADNDLNDAIVVGTRRASRQRSLRGFEISVSLRGAIPKVLDFAAAELAQYFRVDPGVFLA